MKTFIEHLVGIEDVECAATYRAAMKGWQSGHYVAPGLVVIHDSLADRHEQDKTMPDRVVKAQALPDMKERAERVETQALDRDAACRRPEMRSSRLMVGKARRHKGRALRASGP
jgi:hypothetical protein